MISASSINDLEGGSGGLGKSGAGRAGNVELLILGGESKRSVISADSCTEINGFKNCSWKLLEALGSSYIGPKAHFGKQFERNQLF